MSSYMDYNKFCREVISEIVSSNCKTQKEVIAIRNLVSKKYKTNYSPTLIQLLIHCNSKERDLLLKILRSKPTRTLSGVVPVAVMTRPHACLHGKCTFCPGGPNSYFGNVPQSYTGKEPSTMRAIRANYDPYEIVFNRLEQYIILGHSPEKVEIILQGGTFPAFTIKEQEEIVTLIFKALNDFSKLFYKNNKLNYEKFKKFFELPTNDIHDKQRTLNLKNKIKKLKTKTTLEKEQKKNETSQIRCVGLTIETKPDWGFLSHGNQMLKLGCTRIELGVESVYEDVLQKTHRGHSLQDTIKSIQELKDLGFKLNYHYMLGLPLTDKKRDLKGLHELFDNQSFRPDMMKVYPCMVLKGTSLYADYISGKFKPITTKEAASMIAELNSFIPKYCRIMRVQRDIPTYVTEAGVDKTNLNQYVQEVMNKKGITSQEIRAREPRDNVKINNIDILVYEYEASNGKEFFISAEDVKNNVLLGFARLRFPSKSLRNEITSKSALLRELHVYGQSLALSEEGSVQHKGLGKQLMLKAEEICKKNNKNKIVVISGIGVREYYSKKLGYKKQGPYMVKTLA